MRIAPHLGFVATAIDSLHLVGVVTARCTIHLARLCSHMSGIALCLEHMHPCRSLRRAIDIVAAKDAVDHTPLHIITALRRIILYHVLIIFYLYVKFLFYTKIRNFLYIKEEKPIFHPPLLTLFNINYKKYLFEGGDFIIFTNEFSFSRDDSSYIWKALFAFSYDPKGKRPHRLGISHFLLGEKPL